MADDVGLGAWLARLGLPAGAAAALMSVANIDLWLVPLTLWGIAFVMRRSGVRLFSPAPDNLRKSIN